MYEQESPRWNDIDRGKSLICPKGLSDNLTSRDMLLQRRRKYRRKCSIWPYEIFLSYFERFFSMPQNPEANGFTSPSKKSVLQNFIAPGPVRTGESWV
jgi:hypothetical protein